MERAGARLCVCMYVHANKCKRALHSCICLCVGRKYSDSAFVQKIKQQFSEDDCDHLTYNLKTMNCKDILLLGGISVMSTPMPIIQKKIL